MFRIASVATALVALASVSAASAADFPVKTVHTEPAWSWTGLYIGGHAGGAWGTVESEFPGGALAVSSHNLNGFLGGGQLGMNWQSGVVVIGVEADASTTNLKGTAPCAILAILVCKTDAKWMATFTGRLGFAVDRALVYAKFGGAWANFSSSASILGINIATNNDYSLWGVTTGAGVEYAFAPGWSAKVEYDYSSFGKRTIPFTTVLGAVTNIDVTDNIHVVKFGVNYKIGFGAVSAYN